MQKLSPDAVEDRKVFAAEMTSEFARVYAEVKGVRLSEEDKKLRTLGPTTDDFLSGAVRARKQEQLTTEHQQLLAEIEAEERKQDDILGELEVALEGLKHLANAIHDNVESQNVVLDEALVKVDTTAAKLDHANDRLKEATKRVCRRLKRLAVVHQGWVHVLNALHVVFSVADQRSQYKHLHVCDLCRHLACAWTCLVQYCDTRCAVSQAGKVEIRNETKRRGCMVFSLARQRY
jgi:hypothetical protein